MIKLIQKQSNMTKSYKKWQRLTAIKYKQSQIRIIKTRREQLMLIKTIKFDQNLWERTKNSLYQITNIDVDENMQAGQGLIKLIKSNQKFLSKYDRNFVHDKQRPRLNQIDKNDLRRLTLTTAHQTWPKLPQSYAVSPKSSKRDHILPGLTKINEN